MPAIMDQSSYDQGNQFINASVTVSRSGLDGFSFQVPPLVIKGPQAGESSPYQPWTVRWCFVPDASLDGFSDADYKIEIPAQNTCVPQEVTLKQNGPSLWEITFTTGTVSLSTFSYDIVAVAGGAQQVKDPTIALVPEPMG